MAQKTHVMHGRDHCPGGSDPIPCLSGVGPPPRDPNAWQDLVATIGPRFEWVFQDDDADGQFDDITGNGHTLTIGAGGGPTTRFVRSTDAHMFASQTYSGKAQNSNICFATSNPGGSWGNGQTGFSLEVWFRRSANLPGALFCNDASSSSGTTWWGLAFDATSHVYLRRYGTTFTSTIVPPLNEWHQYVVVGDGTHALLYYDGAVLSTITDPAGSTGSLVIVCREPVNTGSGSYNNLAGYYGAVVGYDASLTAAQVFDLYQAGLAAGNPADTPTPPAGSGGSVTPAMIEPGANGTWLHTVGGAVIWQPITAAFTGTPDGTKFLRDDLSWQAVPAGGTTYRVGSGAPASGLGVLGDLYEDISSATADLYQKQSVAAAPTYRSAADTAHSATTTHDATMPAGVVAGDLLLMTITTAVGSVAVNTPSGWTLAVGHNGGSGYYHAIYTRTATGTEGATVPITSPSNQWTNISILAYQGASVDAIGDFGSVQSSVGSPVLPSVTSTVPNDLAVGIAMLQNNVAASATATGWTFRRRGLNDSPSQSVSLFMEKTLTAAGASGTTTLTMSPTQNYTGWTYTAALKPSATGTPTWVHISTR